MKEQSGELNSPGSPGEYNALLSVFNIQVKHIRGEEAGNLFNGIIYCATDDRGEPAGIPIKSSRMGKTAGYEALIRKMKKTEGLVKEGKVNPGRNKNLIRDAMLHCTGRERFEEVLKLRGIDVVFRQNGEGRIYGVTFIDHNLRMAYNGSRLGKEFSANVFHNLFEEKGGRETQSRDLGNPAADIGMAIPASYRPPATVDDIFGTFYLDSTGHDPQEEAFIRKMRRRKKRGRGRKMP